MIDKYGIIPKLAAMKNVVIEPGCGTAPHIQDGIGFDQTDLDTVDIIYNLEEGLPFLPDKCVDVIYSFSFP